MWKHTILSHLTLAFWLSLSAAPSAAECPPSGRIVTVPFGATEVPLPAVGGTVLTSANLVATPIHGELVTAVGGYLYRPRGTFWSLGTDQLVLTRFDAQLGTVVETLHFVANTGELESTVLDVEQNLGILPTSWSRSDPSLALSSETAAALNGSYGLEIDLAGAPTAPAFLRYQWIAQASEDVGGGNEGGNGEQGSGAAAGWKPPRPPSGLVSSNGAFTDSETILLSLREPSATLPRVQVRQRTSAEGVALRLELVGEDLGTSRWVSLSPVPHQILLRAWPSDEAATGGAALFIDGELVTKRQALPTPAGFPLLGEARFGAEGTSGALPILSLDRLRSHLADDGSRSFCLRNDGFDQGNFSGWTLTAPEVVSTVPGFVGPSSLSIALQGTSDLGAMLKVPESLALQQAARLGVRFQVNPGPLVLSSSAAVTLADGKLNLTQSAFRLKLEQVGTTRQLRLEGRSQGPSMVSTTAPMPAGSPVLELDWQRSPSTVEGTGYVRLYANGNKIAQLPLLANAAQSLSVVQIGALAPGGSGSGSIELDRVEVWAEP
jgi:hypothetical protein